MASYVLRPDADRYIVTIKPGSGYLGIMSGESASSAEEAEPVVIELFAGYEAEKRLNPSIGDMADTGSGSDLVQAEEFARWIWASDDEIQVGLSGLQEKTASMVRENWKLIQALAEELLIHEIFQQEEADLILDIASGAEDPERLVWYRHYVKQKL